MKFVLIGTHSPEWIGRPKERAEKASQKVRELGLSVVGSYYTQGEFDFVTIIEAPDVSSASAFSIWYIQSGFGQVRTMLAHSAAEMNEVVAKI